MRWVNFTEGLPTRLPLTVAQSLALSLPLSLARVAASLLTLVSMVVPLAVPFVVALVGIATFGLSELARGSPTWERIDVPGGTCGNGDPYAVFLRRGRPDRLALELRGGGACWDSFTCFGPIPFTHLQLDPISGALPGLASTTPSESPFFDATYVVFPYCTGDVYAGVGTAEYGGRRVYHQGHTNIEQSLGTLEHMDGLFDSVNEVYLMGRSAGAIGALFHMPSVEPLFPHARKVALLDSPGLHFGERFWGKFSASYFQAIQNRMSGIGIELVANNGNVAEQIPGFCNRFSNWRMGFLQSTRDRVMSLLFGNISQAAHARLVMSPAGLSELARSPSGDCHVWVHDSAQHTFTGSLEDLKSRVGNITAFEFVSTVSSERPPSSTLP